MLLIRPLPCVGLLVALAACGPVSPESAASACEQRAREAQGVFGEIGIGINSNGRSSSGVALGVSSDFIQGRDPLQVYETCVRQKTGQGPIRPPVLR